MGDPRLFREAAAAAGLVYTDWSNQCGTDKFGHNFNLNAGDVVCMPEPRQVRELVELASRYAVLPTYGEHLALLGLGADETDVEAFEAGRSQILLWRSSVSTGSGTGRISLREWLAARGQVSEIGADNFWDEGALMAHEFPGGRVPQAVDGGSTIFADTQVEWGAAV